MEVVVRPTAQDASALAADAIEQLLDRRPGATLGLATGSSPLGVYDELVRRVRAGTVTLRRASGFLLDEYVGLPRDHEQSYRSVIRRDLVSRVDLDPARVHGPDGTAPDLVRECAAYEEALLGAGGVDLQLLGVGTDGHLAFNEPGSSLASRTRLKTLTAQTRADNARFFGGDPEAVPRHCLTQGIGTIREARHLVVLAFGPAKAEAVRQLVEGPVSASWPATALQLHRHVTVLVDPEAAARLDRLDQYTETYAAKPTWQGL
ncbi:MAG: glucosamine-6-phosphate deaminase [Marmoricola sp.]|nr:glucosamine-6-phosphate deaminase [Marmoricola sp.]